MQYKSLLYNSDLGGAQHTFADHVAVLGHVTNRARLLLWVLSLEERLMEIRIELLPDAFNLLDLKLYEDLFEDVVSH